MRKTSAEKAVRRNITLPASFVARLEALKQKRGGASDSEIIRHALSLFEAITDRNAKIILRDNENGNEAEILLP